MDGQRQLPVAGNSSATGHVDRSYRRHVTSSAVTVAVAVAVVARVSFMMAQPHRRAWIVALVPRRMATFCAIRDRLWPSARNVDWHYPMTSL
jgi:hypothetical protein